MPSRDDERDALREDLRLHRIQLSLQTEALGALQRQTERQGRDHLHLIDHLPVAICQIDAGGRIAHANLAAVQLLQQPADRLRGQWLHRFGLNEHSQSVLLQHLQQTAPAAAHPMSPQWLRTGSEARLVMLHITLPPAPIAVHGEFTVTLLDQTRHHQRASEHREAEEALLKVRALNQELSLVANRSPSSVMILDAHLRIRWVNPAFSRQTGYSLAEARHQHPHGLLGRASAPLHGEHGAQGPPEVEDAEAALRQLQADLAHGGGIEHRVVQRRCKDGSTYRAEVSIVPHYDERSQVTRYIVLEQDISDREQAAREREALRQVQARHMAKTEFLSRMSHNMRTPLNAVLGFSQLLEQTSNPPLVPPQREKLRIIHDAGQQLLSLVDEALQLARVEHDMERYEPQCVSLPQLLADCALMLHDKATDRHIDVRIDTHHAGDVNADAQRVREIVHNLLSNAIKYSDPGSRVDVQALYDSAAHEVVIHVRDHGRGIARSDHGRLFQPFVRLDSTRDMATGHGMGLAICKRLAELMQGTLSVDSDPGWGSVFSLSLPAADTARHRSGPPQPTEPVATPQGRMPELPPMRLLCVEDNEMNRRLIESALAHAPQVQLCLASTLAEARLAAMAHRPDTVLLDMNLPDGHGLDLSRELRALLTGPGAPAPPAGQAPLRIIALSADAHPEHVEAALRNGVDDYLVKPLQIQRLWELLQGHTAPR